MCVLIPPILHIIQMVISMCSLQILTGSMVIGFTLLFTCQFYKKLIRSPLRHIPGPKLFALTKWRLAYEEYHGRRTHCVDRLHQQYGEVVRVGPSEVSFKSLSARRQIYGCRSEFQRARFYEMFDAYGRKVLFSLADKSDHAQRKRQLSQAYTKTAVMSQTNQAMIETNVRGFLRLIKERCSSQEPVEIFSTLHDFAMDITSQFVYGALFPASKCVIDGTPRYAQVLADILDPSRWKVFWWSVFFPNLTRWLYTRSYPVKKILKRLGIIPTTTLTYTGLREYCLRLTKHLQQQETYPADGSLFAHLMTMGNSPTTAPTPMDILDIAAECSDHVLAGIDTTSNALLWIIYHLSQPENKIYQDELRAEIRSFADASSPTLISPETASKLSYLEAIIKEALRLNPPSRNQPRVSANDETIDGYLIPRGTVVSISPYTLHRHARVFANPLKFDPERWLGPRYRVAEMNQWFWAFSSGARMCIGTNLAMAELTTLLANVYRLYSTVIPAKYAGVSPGMVARGDLFYDERCGQVMEHECWIRFVPE